MTAAASPTALAGVAPAPESARAPTLPSRDTTWSKALIEAEAGNGGMADWTAPQDAPMQGLTASGDAIMRQSAVAMTIGLVAPVVASASVQPAYGTPMPAASVKHPDAPATATHGRTAPSAGVTRPALPQRAPEAGKSAQAPAPVAALKAMVQAQLGRSVAIAAGAADTLPQATASSGPRVPGRPSIVPGPAAPGNPTTSIPAVPSDDLVALPPVAGHGGIVQLTGLGPAEEAGSAEDLAPQAPPANRSGIVQLTGQDEIAEPDETLPAEPETAVPAQDLPHLAATTEAEGHEPVRLHAEWSEAGVKVWLGTDVDQLPNVPVLAQQVQQWLAGQGERLLALVCNGQDMTSEIEAGLDFASQSGEGWTQRPLPRPASLSDHS